MQRVKSADTIVQPSKIISEKQIKRAQRIFKECDFEPPCCGAGLGIKGSYDPTQYIQALFEHQK